MVGMIDHQCFRCLGVDSDRCDRCVNGRIRRHPGTNPPNPPDRLIEIPIPPSSEEAHVHYVRWFEELHSYTPSLDNCVLEAAFHAGYLANAK